MMKQVLRGKLKGLWSTCPKVSFNAHQAATKGNSCVVPVEAPFSQAAIHSALLRIVRISYWSNF